MAVTGDWTVFYDWGCDGGYSTAPITVNSDGTWESAPFTGLWDQVAGMFMFNFDGFETIYSGNLAGDSITGIMSTFSGPSASTGCFYMLKSGVPTSFAAMRIKEKADLGGKE